MSRHTFRQIADLAQRIAQHEQPGCGSSQWIYWPPGVPPPPPYVWAGAGEYIARGVRRRAQAAAMLRGDVPMPEWIAAEDAAAAEARRSDPAYAPIIWENPWLKTAASGRPAACSGSVPAAAAPAAGTAAAALPAPGFPSVSFSPAAAAQGRTSESVLPAAAADAAAAPAPADSAGAEDAAETVPPAQTLPAAVPKIPAALAGTCETAVHAPAPPAASAPEFTALSRCGAETASQEERLPAAFASRIFFPESDHMDLPAAPAFRFPAAPVQSDCFGSENVFAAAFSGGGILRAGQLPSRAAGRPACGAGRPPAAERAALPPAFSARFLPRPAGRLRTGGGAGMNVCAQLLPAGDRRPAASGSPGAFAAGGRTEENRRNLGRLAVPPPPASPRRPFAPPRPLLRPWLRPAQAPPHRCPAARASAARPPPPALPEKVPRRASAGVSLPQLC